MLQVHREGSAVNLVIRAICLGPFTYSEAREFFKDFLVLSCKKNFKRPSLLSICFVGIGVG